MSTGYSATPLAAKLGIDKSEVLVVIGDPGHFVDLLGPLPDGITVRRSARGRADVAVFFTTRVAQLARRIEVLGRLVFPDGAIWVCWPKRTSGVPTDVTENVVRDIVLPLRLVDVKVAAIDATWSGLKVVWRKEART